MFKKRYIIPAIIIVLIQILGIALFIALSGGSYIFGFIFSELVITIAYSILLYKLNFPFTDLLKTLLIVFSLGQLTEMLISFVITRNFGNMYLGDPNAVFIYSLILFSILNISFCLQLIVINSCINFLKNT